MPGLKDAASMAALDSPIPAGMPPLAPEDMAPPGGPPMPGGGIEDGIAMIEGALEGAPPDLAEEARTHVNALREIATKIGGEGAPPPDEEAPSQEEIPPMPEVS